MVSRATLSNIASGRHSGEISDEVARGIALAIDRPVREVLKAARKQVSDDPRPFELPQRAHRLTRAQRGTVLSVIDAILDAADQTEPVPSTGLRRVARPKSEPAR
jgi:transcriptional regulator with XRE-family HTH domain